MSAGPRSDPVEREAARLAAEPGTVVLEGFHCVKHALRFGADVPLLLTTDRAGTLGLAAELAPDLAERLARALRPAPRALLDRLAAGGPWADVVGLARRPPPGPDTGPGPAVLLDNPRNPGNVGAAVRVAAGFGARAVLTTGSVDPWHPAVLRGSAGLHFATAVRRVEPGDPALAAGPLLAFDPAGQDLRGVEVPDHAVLAFGSERHGLSEGVRRRADRLVAIPMRELVSSYNLATSVAIGLYHWSRGR